VRTAILAAAAVLAAGPAAPAERFEYAGIGLDSRRGAIESRFPNSKLVGDELRIDPRDSRDHVYAIRFAGSRAPRAVRIGFERPAEGERRKVPRFPKCKAVEGSLRARYGAPDEVRKSVADGAQRADRLWNGARETLTLACFVGPGTELLAEAVVIAER
jgi:hypothetical protein